MRNRFDRQLKELNNEMIEMGAMIEAAIEKAVSALVNQDVEKAKEAVKGDDVINHQEKNIENLCLKLLLQQQPVARDLRQISAGYRYGTNRRPCGRYFRNYDCIGITALCEEIRAYSGNGKRNDANDCESGRCICGKR